MPELPELEDLRRRLVERLGGIGVASTRARQFALVKTFDPPLEALLGQTVTGADRHGKHLILHVGSELTLVIHLGIGGRVVLAGPGRKLQRTVSLEVGLDDGGAVQIVELGTKKRSSVHVLHRSDVPDHLRSLGPDALSPDLTPGRLADLLRAERVQLKRFLTDQRRVAGIGNAYSDEILWEARLAPLRLTTSLKDAELQRLYEAMHVVLPRAIEGAREDNYLLAGRADKRGSFRVHRRDGEPCPRCGKPIASVHLADSSMQYCPTCQDGRRYADRRISRLLR